MRYALAALALSFGPLLAFAGCAAAGAEAPLGPIPTPLSVRLDVCGPLQECVADGPLVLALLGGYYGCLNYEVVGRTGRSGRTARVTLHGVEARGLCPTALGPASGRFGLGGAPFPELLEIVHGDRTARYGLRFAADSVALVPLDTAFTTPRPWRRP